ncbi:serine/threonine transporter SstT [Methanobrevibacter sp.]|uniref:serine/threonine transporter SstT n=1 Tax=Methanobrevibacter sp. TaxID=66852 RepID=UPI00386D44A6
MDIVKKWTESSLILKILVGVIVGAILGFFVPQWSVIGFVGEIFVSALKAIAPILVFVLVASAISKAKSGIGPKYRMIIIIFLLTNFIAALVAVLMCYMFPLNIYLSSASVASAPGGLGEIMRDMILNIFSNPIKSLAEGEYLGILFWSIIIGFALRIVASDATKDVIEDIADSITKVVNFIIQFAPIGIMGLVFTSVSESGLGIFTEYGQLLLLIVGCMVFVGLVINPFISFLLLKRNPYPLLLTCLRDSGITAFFSRSSAANIPINMQLCERLGIDRDFFSISIPLGSTINTNGAAITITIMTVVTCYTLGIPVPFSIALVLCVVSTLAACGASGIVGGSLLLIPLACSLFGISPDISMQVVAVGFVISVVQDSFETALNSSCDVFFTAVTEYYYRAKNGEQVDLMGDFVKNK